MQEALSPGNQSLCEKQAEFCAIFTNPARIRMMLLLRDREMSVGELAEELGISMPNLSQHLRLMRERNCLKATRRGKHIHYRITSPLFVQAMSLVRQGIQDAERLAQSDQTPALKG